jgi:hypothetical protein
LRWAVALSIGLIAGSFCLCIRIPWELSVLCIGIPRELSILCIGIPRKLSILCIGIPRELSILCIGIHRDTGSLFEIGLIGALGDRRISMGLLSKGRLRGDVIENRELFLCREFCTGLCLLSCPDFLPERRKTGFFHRLSMLFLHNITLLFYTVIVYHEIPICQQKA